MTDLKLELSSNKFGNDIINTYENLHNEKDFTDVTIVSNDGDMIKAHKVVLGACSQFFKQVFLEKPHEHPLLFLKGIKIVLIVELSSLQVKFLPHPVKLYPFPVHLNKVNNMNL